MIGLDTNALVRYITRDEPDQYRAAKDLILRAVAQQEDLLINVIVLCEMVWVLRSAYGVDKSGIVKVIQQILATKQFVVEDRVLVRQACNAYEAGSGDFSDHLIGVRNLSQGCAVTETFDRALVKSGSFSVMGS